MKTKVIQPKVQKGSPIEIHSDAVIAPVFQDGSLPPSTKDLDQKLSGRLKKEMQKSRFEGEVGKSLWVSIDGHGAKKILLFGLGKKDEFDRDVFRDAMGSAAQKLAAGKVEKVVIPFLTGPGFSENFEVGLEGFLLGTYRFNKYKTKPEKPQTIEEVFVAVPDANAAKNAEKIVNHSVVRAEATCMARDMINEPANIVTPTYMEKRAREVAKSQGMKITVLDEENLRKRGMNLILAVGMGSKERPRLVHMEHKPKGKVKRTIAFIGKGVTFDSGGLSLKGQDNMYGMKCDMSGSAAVLATMWAVSELNLPVHVHGIFPLVENLPSSHSSKPGDVFVGLNGKSVEIENTDAEGRLILADALAYTKDLNVDEILDAATLTGAVVVALGDDIAAVFSDDDGLVGRIDQASKRAGEKFWRLPLEKAYMRLLKSDVADLRNVGGRYGGAITAGLFLAEFAPKDVPWAHLDIAGPAFIGHEWPICPKGGTGFAVRTFIEFASAY